MQNAELEAVVALRRQRNVRGLHQLEQLFGGHQTLLHHKLPSKQAVRFGALRNQPDRFVHVVMMQQIVENGLRIVATIAAIHVRADCNESR